MPALDHASTAIADSYAETLLTLSEEANNSDEVLDEFRQFVSLMNQDAAFGRFMVNPAVDVDARRDVLEKHFRGKLTDLLLNTLQVINRKARGELIRLIFERYRLALEELRNELDVQVISAVPLTDELREKIRQAAARVTGKTPRLVEKVEAGILGGLVIRMGDEKVDNSVIRHLHRMRGSLIDRASREIHGNKEYFESIAG